MYFNNVRKNLVNSIQRMPGTPVTSGSHFVNPGFSSRGDQQQEVAPGVGDDSAIRYLPSRQKMTVHRDSLLAIEQLPNGPVIRHAKHQAAQLTLSLIRPGPL